MRSEDNRDQSLSCRKSRRILDVFFALPSFRGLAFRKWYPHYLLCPAARRLEKVSEDTPTSAEVIVAHTLNFRPNFKFLRLNLGRALGSLGQSLTRVKISGDSTHNGRNVVSRKMSTRVGQYEPL